MMDGLKHGSEGHPPMPLNGIVEATSSVAVAEAFLRILDPEAEAFTFQTFDDNQDRRDRALAKVFHGAFDEHSATLAEMNARGAGVFVTVNETDGNGRKRENIIRLRAVWQDDDGDGKGSFPVEPHLVVNTSPDKYQRIWLVDGLTIKAHEGIMACLIEDYGSDPGAKDIARVLRLPGFDHRKVNTNKGLSGEPYPVQIIEQNKSRPYTVKQMLEAFPPVLNGSRAPDLSTVSGCEASTTANSATIADLRSALTHLRADDRDRWIKVGIALACLGDVGRGLWLNWSATSEAHDPANDAAKWDDDIIKRYSGEPGDASYRQVFLLAQNAGWVNPLASTKATMDTRVEREQDVSPLAFLEKYVMTDEQLSQLQETKNIIPHLIWQGHILMLVSAPNGGKTAVMMYQAAKMAKMGYRVFYANADVGGGDVSKLVKHSKAHGYKMLLPDFVEGGGMADVVTHLEHLAKDLSVELAASVFIFDTLKKMGDLLHKDSAKKLMLLLRRLTARGATVVCLAHTNKYADAEGRPVYEGTHDVLTDTDEMIFLVPTKHPDGDGIITSTLTPVEKRRVPGVIKPLTWHIDSEYNVVEHAHVDTLEDSKERKVLHDYAIEIEAITNVIRSGKTGTTELIGEAMNAPGCTRRRIESALKNQTDKLWRRERALSGHRYDFRLLEPDIHIDLDATQQNNHRPWADD